MRDFGLRLQNIVDELALVQRELNEQLIAGPACDAAAPPAASADDLEAVRDLKCAVDQLRHFLWFYLQAISRSSEPGEKTLQLLRQVAKNPQALAQQSSLSFVERLNALAEYALVHYRGSDSERPN